MRPHKREEFTDKQKAEIFALDRAVCAFSGKSLWVADYHLCPTYDIDWCDHIKPAMRGGTNDTDNGVCASSFFNMKKKDNSHDNKYFFFRGKPTQDFYYFYEIPPPKIQDNLTRFENLHWTDWFANRAWFVFMLALEYLHNPYLKNGKKQIRDDEYYSKACLKRILQWKKLTENENVSSLHERRIFCGKISDEQKILLSLLEVENLEQVQEILQQAFSIYQNNCQVFETFVNGEEISAEKLEKASGYMRGIVLSSDLGV